MQHPDTPAQRPTIWFDATDLLDHLEWRRGVNGIQRVVASVLSVLDAGAGAGDAGDAVRPAICRFDFRQQRYVAVPAEALRRQVASLIRGDGPPGSAPSALLRLRKTLRSLLPPALRLRGSRDPAGSLAAEGPDSAFRQDMFASGDTLVMLGAFWHRPPYLATALRACRANRLRFALMVHDLIPLAHPGDFPPDFLAYWSASLDLALAGADRVIVNSRHSRDALLAHAAGRAMRAAQPEVIRLGDELLGELYGEAAAHASGHPGRAELLPAPYALMVSSTDRRKNHELALRVWSELHARHRERTPHLVFVGGAGATQRRMQEQARAAPRVILMGRTDDASLAALYRGALFTLYPSRAEGWGLPVAESLRHGKLCLASNATSIPEVGGDLAAYFDPNDAAGCLALVERYAFDPAARAAAEARIRAEYRPARWRDTAAAILDICNRP